MDAVLLAGLTALCAATTLGIAAGAVGADERARVQRSLAAVRATRVGGAPVLQAAEVPFRQRVAMPVLAAAGRLARRLSGRGVVPTVQRRLELAGNPRGLTVDRVLGLKGLGLMVGVVVGAVLGSGLQAVFMAVLGGAVGLLLPDLLVHDAGSKRQDQIARSLADSMDLLTISVEAGLGFDAALSQVAQHTDGPLAGEMFRVLQEMQIGTSRSDAFRALAGRTTVPELKAFVSSLVQADAFGIPVARVLREQSKELRVKRRQRAEERAQKVPVKIMVPLVLFIFPVIFIVVLGPAAAGWMAS